MGRAQTTRIKGKLAFPTWMAWGGRHGGLNAQLDAPLLAPVLPSPASRSERGLFQRVRGIVERICGPRQRSSSTRDIVVIRRQIQIHGQSMPAALANPTNVTSPTNSLPESDSADAAHVAQVICSSMLLCSCMLATGLIFCETLDGMRVSVYCKLQPRRFAPTFCVAPLALSAGMCDVSVIAALLCVARFAWRTGNLRSGEVAGRAAEVDRHRSVLQSDLRYWRRTSVRILLIAGIAYLTVGTTCAAFAKHALIFLASGFITLYATAVFFDDHMDNPRFSPRCARFMGMYFLVGITFLILRSGMAERVYNFSRSIEHDDDSDATVEPNLSDICGPYGSRTISPQSCTVPLDFAAACCLWWISSPLFAVLLPTRVRRGASGSTQILEEMRGGPRRFLQRWRHWIDAMMCCWMLAVLLLLETPCRASSPIAMRHAEWVTWLVGLVSMLRYVSPWAFDSWRGPLEHLHAPPTFSIAQCAICLVDFVPHDDVCRTPCAHDFHRGCLEEWVWSNDGRRAACPMCREPLDLPSALPQGVCGILNVFPDM